MTFDWINSNKILFNQHVLQQRELLNEELLEFLEWIKSPEKHSVVKATACHENSTLPSDNAGSINISADRQLDDGQQIRSPDSQQVLGDKSIEEDDQEGDSVADLVTFQKGGPVEEIDKKHFTVASNWMPQIDSRRDVIFIEHPQPIVQINPNYSKETALDLSSDLLADDAPSHNVDDPKTSTSSHSSEDLLKDPNAPGKCPSKDTEHRQVHSSDNTHSFDSHSEYADQNKRPESGSAAQQKPPPRDTVTQSITDSSNPKESYRIRDTLDSITSSSVSSTSQKEILKANKIHELNQNKQKRGVGALFDKDKKVTNFSSNSTFTPVVKDKPSSAANRPKMAVKSLMEAAALKKKQEEQKNKKQFKLVHEQRMQAALERRQEEDQKRVEILKRKEEEKWKRFHETTENKHQQDADSNVKANKPPLPIIVDFPPKPVPKTFKPIEPSKGSENQNINQNQSSKIPICHPKSAVMNDSHGRRSPLSKGSYTANVYKPHDGHRAQSPSKLAFEYKHNHQGNPSQLFPKDKESLFKKVLQDNSKSTVKDRPDPHDTSHTQGEYHEPVLPDLSSSDSSSSPSQSSSITPGKHNGGTPTAKKSKRKYCADWASTPAIKKMVAQQLDLNPDNIFDGQMQTPNLERIFNSNKVRLRSRTSSAYWAGPDALTMHEKKSYNEQMGFQ